MFQLCYAAHLHIYVRWCLNDALTVLYGLNTSVKRRSFCDRLFEYVIEEIISTENPDNGTYITVTSQNAKWKGNV